MSIKSFDFVGRAKSFCGRRECCIVAYLPFFSCPQSEEQLQSLGKELIQHTKKKDVEDVRRVFQILDTCDVDRRKVTEYADSQERTAVAWACRKGDIAVLELLLQSQACVDPPNERKRTPLSTAVQNNQVDVVSTLIKFGADINAQDMDGNTPLHRALKNKRGVEALQPVIEVLMKAGASTNLKNDAGRTVTEVAEKQGVSSIFAA